MPPQTPETNTRTCPYFQEKMGCNLHSKWYVLSESFVETHCEGDYKSCSDYDRSPMTQCSKLREPLVDPKALLASLPESDPLRRGNWDSLRHSHTGLEDD